MTPFSYARPGDVGAAVRERASSEAAAFIAGGTNLIDLVKYDVVRPTRLVDITGLPGLDRVEEHEGGLRLGALATNAQVAYDPRVEQRYPLLTSTLLAGATTQLRNAATTGGNLLQRTRCYYFYDVGTPCNKREPGSGCPAITGVNRIHAILGASEHCIATAPSDQNVALAALAATVRVAGPGGERLIPIEEFHRLPSDEPQRDTTLEPGELVLSVDLPAEDFSRHYTYLKLRDRTSYAFALVSVAAALQVEGGAIREARLALGGVAHKPWRDREAEAMLRGQAPGADLFRAVADKVLAGARGYSGNSFKIELARRAVVRALEQAAAGTPQSQIDKRIQ